MNLRQTLRLPRRQKLVGWFGGPGSPSVDKALGIEHTGPFWALAALTAGAVGSTLAMEAGKREQ
jgi:hypothetical protein